MMTTTVACTQLVLATILAAPAAMAAGAVVAAPHKEALFWSTHQPNEKVAINKAMSNCGARYGGGCFLEKAFSSGCMAVARNASHHQWGYAWSESGDDARATALQSCAASGSNTCSIQAEKCE